MIINIMVDDLKVEMGVNFQKNLPDCIPDSPMYQELFHALAQSNNADVRSNVAYKDNISEETALLLLGDKDPNVLDRIVSNEIAKTIVRLDQVRDILDRSGIDTAKSIINNMAEYENIEVTEIANIILDMNVPSLDLEMAESWSTPKAILKKLSEKSDDPDIRHAAQKTLE